MMIYGSCQRECSAMLVAFHGLSPFFGGPKNAPITIDEGLSTEVSDICLERSVPNCSQTEPRKAGPVVVATASGHRTLGGSRRQPVDRREFVCVVTPGDTSCFPASPRDCILVKNEE